MGAAVLALLGPVLGLIILATVPLRAQGVTDAAIEGRIVGVDSAPVDQAVVHVTNTSTGERWKSTSSARGRYFIEYLSVGGPYRIEVAAIGYQPARRDSVRLGLGQRLTVHFTLTPAVLQLEEITVSGTDPRFDPARTGPAQIITDSLIARLPVKRRDYTELALLSPQVTKSPNGGLSFAGQHDRYNSIQIDGTNNNDPFGRMQSGNGTPGWAVGLTAFVPEAVKELQVVSAPFDVRYGGFSGGLINAVTKSGTNQVEGSILGYFENADLTGTDGTGNRAGEFSRKEIGLTLGTPIVRDRVAAFVTADWREEVIPQSTPVPSTNTDSAGYSNLVRFQDLLRSNGVEPGSFSAGAFHAPTRKLFVKVTAQLGVGSRLMVSHNYGHGTVQDGTLGRAPGYYPLSSSGTEHPETINATRLAWTRVFSGRFSNKLILARVDDRRTCLPSSGLPTVSLWADGGELLAGGALGCLGLEAGHTLWEVMDNFGMVAGNHRLILGIHGEQIDMVDDVVTTPNGLWFFDSLDSLEQGEPAAYTRDFPLAGASQVALLANQLSVYLQDQWLTTPRLTLTGGLRLDVPTVPMTPTKHLVAARELGINTALTPSGNALWSPRLGVNYDLSGRGTTVLRGGAGLFAGHPAYIWFRNVYSSTGARALTIECTGDDVPEFTLDLENRPDACDEPSTAARPFTHFAPEFRYPQTLKLAVGADHLLPGGIIGTLDFLYTRGVNSVEVADVNLAGPVGTAAGEGGRAIYGAIDPETGEAEPDRRSDDLRGVYQLRNGSGDRSYSVTVQLQKQFPRGTEVSAAYTYTDAKDRMNMDGNIGILNAASTPVSGTLEDRELRSSFWERAHKVTLAATTGLPLGFRFGFTYFGMSGAPYTYVFRGDPNADGTFLPPFSVSNDVAYVPRDAADITLLDPADYAALDSLILEEPCLRNQRGRLLERNSCRDPWVHETAAQLSKVFPLGGRRALEVTADLFNLLSFLDSDWGVVRATAMDIGNTVPLLDFLGWDASNGRGVYGPTDVYRREIDVEASRWRLQLGATVTF
jgi:hypothetical protein